MWPFNKPKKPENQESRYFDISGTDENKERFLSCVGMSIDAVFEKAEVVLNIFPQPLRKVKILLYDTAGDVRKLYWERYKKALPKPAFISLEAMEIVISVEDVNLKIFVHEVAHTIIEQYFRPRPPYALHELMAQYCEKHFND